MMLELTINDIFDDAELVIILSNTSDEVYLTISDDDHKQSIEIKVSDLITAFKMIEEMVEQRKPRLLGPNLTDEKLRNQDA